MKKILILGKQSPLAVAIYELILKETDWKVSLELDNYKIINDSENSRIITPILYDKKSIRKLVLEYAPNYIINCLSNDNIEYCEQNKKESWDYNVGITEALSKAAFMTESKLIFFSTDKIYNGSSGPYSEDHLPDPVNYYGKTKLGCENICISSNTAFVSVRLPEYYGNNNSIGNNIFYSLINEEVTELSDNIFTTPVLLDDIALGVIKIIEKNKSGIYNFSGPEYLSEYEYGIRIGDYLSLDKSKIIPVTYQPQKEKAKKMHRGGLINLKSEIDLDLKFVNLHSGLTTVRFQINYNT